MKKTIVIGGMMCNGCVRRVENSLGALGAQYDVDLGKGCAVVESDKEISEDILRETIEALGFEVISIS